MNYLSKEKSIKFKLKIYKLRIYQFSIFNILYVFFYLIIKKLLYNLQFIILLSSVKTF